MADTSNREEIAKLEALYANNPEGRVFTHLAEAYRKAGELDRARAILQDGLARHPAYASAHVVLGRVLADQQNLDEAAEEFRRVLDLDPHNHVALRCLGDIARSAGRRDDAIRYFTELRHLDPNNDDLGRLIAELQSAPDVAVMEESQPAPIEGEASEAETVEAAAPVEAAAAAEAATHVEATQKAEPAPEPEMPPEPATETAELEPAYAAAAPSTPPEAEEEAETDSDVGEDLEFDWVPELDDEAEEAGLPGDLAELANLGASSAANEPEPAEQPTDFGTVDLSVEEPEAEPAEELSEFSLAGFEEDGVEAPAEPAAFDEPEVAAHALQPEQTGEVLTETIADLYRQQGLYDRAADVYRALIAQRPHDEDLSQKLAEVEAISRGETAEQREPTGVFADEGWEPEPWELAPVSSAPPFEPTAPEIEEPETPLIGSELWLEEGAEAPGEEAEAWIAGAAQVPESAPTPYAWAEAQATSAEPDGGPPISEYFRRLLSWKPSVAVAQSTTAVAPPPETEPETEATLILEEQVFETQSFYDQPPAPPATQASQRDFGSGSEVSARPAATPQPASALPENFDAAAAFEEWFNEAAPPEAAAPPEPPPLIDEESSGEDDDLEMFRSWLQSLKK